MTADNTSSYMVKNLDPFTAYSFRVTAVNGIGPSPVGVASYPIITLREVPSDKPTIVAARNSSATSVWIQWRPLERTQLRGEFQNYRLSYRRRDGGAGSLRELRIDDEQVQSYTIGGLRAYTQYLVSVQVENPAGRSPSATVVVTTDEGDIFPIEHNSAIFAEQLSGNR